MSFTWAKDHCSDSELKRFAAAFLHTKDIQSAVRNSPYLPFTHANHSIFNSTMALRLKISLRRQEANNYQVDWEAAAAEFDPKVKAASFRTVTLRAIKKVQAAAGTAPVEGEDAGGEEKVNGKAKGGKKRKAAAEDDAEEKPKPAKKGKGGKKAKTQTETKGEAEGM